MINLVRRFVFAALALAISSAAFGQLVNGDFESNGPPALVNGDNLNHPAPPWVFPTGSPNVVQVNGGPFTYGGGPQSDASAPGVGIPQHYLDIANSKGVFYQSFTARCTGDVRFGGSFSTRGATLTGGATITLRQGVGTTGTTVAALSTSLPAGSNNSWTPLAGSAALVAGVTYSFVVTMDDNLNLDNAFVTFVQPCPECMRVAIADTDVNCGPNGTFTVTAQVTNLSGHATQFVLITPPPGATYTVSPNVVAAPLNNGGQTNVTVTISGALPGQLICLDYLLQDTEGNTCCFVRRCFFLPEHCCLKVTQISLGCDPGPATYAYTFTVQNLTAFPIQQLVVITSLGTVTPQILTTPIPAGGTSAPITLHLSGVHQGDVVCIILESYCCTVKTCITLPPITIQCD